EERRRNDKETGERDNHWIAESEESFRRGDNAADRQREQHQDRHQVHRQRLGHEQDYRNYQNDGDKCDSHFNWAIVTSLWPRAPRRAAADRRSPGSRRRTKPVW